MAIDMDKDVLKDVVSALQEALVASDRNGMKRDKLKQVVKSVTGSWPSDGLFTQVMWIVGYNTGTNKLYYAQGKVPDEFKKEKKSRFQKELKKLSERPNVDGNGQSLIYEGGDLHLKLTGKDKNGKKVDVSLSPVKKVTIFIATIAGIFLVVNMF